jgi:hypothetical protein
MKRHLNLAAAAVLALAAPALMGFDAADPWTGLEGEWASEDVANCGGANSVTFSYDYPRDSDGEVSRPFIGASNEPRRARLATVLEDGQLDYRVAVRDEGRMTGASELELTVKRPSLWPFTRFGHVTFQVVDDDHLTEAASDASGENLMRALGAAPVTLVRCPAGE